MSTTKLTFLAVLVGTMVCVQCSSSKAPQPTRAHILVATSVGYEVATVTFNTLTHPDRMNGSIAVFRGNAELDALATVDEIFFANPEKIYISAGEPVKLAYKLVDGVIHPLDYDGLAMLTSYYHFEKICEFWRDNLGLNLADYGKFRVMYDPDMVTKGKDLQVSNTVKFNAAFLQGTRDFFLFKTSRLERVPFKMNRAILAHEFGHGIVDYRFARKKAEFYHEATSEADDALHSINEGLADYFAWMVTGRVDEFADSTEHFARERTLPVSWTTKQLGADEEICAGQYYCKGSVLASALYEVAVELGSASVEVGQVIYTALDTFRADWEAHKEDEDFDFHYLLSRLVAAAEDEDKPIYCKKFLKWFDDERNQVELLKTCATFSL